MNALTNNVQIIQNSNNQPLFAIVPWQDYLALVDKHNALIPNEVVGFIMLDNLTPITAWRKYKGLSQSEVALKIGVSQSAYAQMELASKPRAGTLVKIAQALDIDINMLDLY